MSSLNDIKAELESRKTELEERIQAINADITHKNQPLSADWSEQAVERENEEVLEALGNVSQVELRQIKAALQRIENGNYEICVVCEESIPMERLKLIPHTTHCTRCAEELEAQQQHR